LREGLGFRVNPKAIYTSKESYSTPTYYYLLWIKLNGDDEMNFIHYACKK
jgi:hypothetical protein